MPKWEMSGSRAERTVRGRLAALQPPNASSRRAPHDPETAKPYVRLTQVPSTPRQQRAPGQQSLCAVKATKLRFVQARRLLHVFDVCGYLANVARERGNTIEQQPARHGEIAARVVMRD